MNQHDKIAVMTVPGGFRARPMSGFGLVEIMVAVVIGMLGIIVMMQVFALFEGQKRTTTGGDDAISGGAIALNGLQRTIQQSGWGITDYRLIGCPVSGLSATGGMNIPLVPVTINHPAITGHDANTDTLLIVSGNASDAVGGEVLRDSVAFSQTSYVVWAPTAFAQNDRVVAAPATRQNPCAPSASALTLTAVANAPTVGGALQVGAASHTVSIGDWLFNLGPQPSVIAYAIRGGNLTRCDYRQSNCGAVANNGDPAVWVPVANNMVSLRAQYGRDTTDAAVALQDARMDGVVDVWDQQSLWRQATWTAGSVSSMTEKDTPACAVVRVAAVRVALLARNAQPERADGGVHVTTAVPVWMGSDAVAHGIDDTVADAAAFNLGSGTTWPTWQDYRYKVFQTVVPLRNITIKGAYPEC